MRISDAQLSIPMIFLAIALVAVVDASLQNIVFVVAFTTWPRYARIVRAETLSLKQMSFVDLARVAGCTHLRIMLRHILPNVIPSLLVLATLDVPKVILFEAGLSFLGLGIQPPTPSWGGMISDGRAHITLAWWTTTLPGATLLIVALSINIFGDWLRDRLDPMLQI
jgi:peptide/nickel transport system permease protein